MLGLFIRFIKGYWGYRSGHGAQDRRSGVGVPCGSDVFFFFFPLSIEVGGMFAGLSRCVECGGGGTGWSVGAPLLSVSVELDSTDHPVAEVVRDNTNNFMSAGKRVVLA